MATRYTFTQILAGIGITLSTFGGSVAVATTTSGAGGEERSAICTQYVEPPATIAGTGGKNLLCIETTGGGTTTTSSTTTTTVPGGEEFPDFASGFSHTPYVRDPDNFTGGALPNSTTGDCGGACPSGNFRFACLVTALNYQDVIINPGEVIGSNHLHMFFGNAAADEDSDWESLRTTGDGSCGGGPLNRTLYWTPALLNGTGPSAQVVMPTNITVYYKDGGKFASGRNPATDPIEYFPNGFRVIQGYNMANPSDPRNSNLDFFWQCSADQVKTTTIPSCTDADDGNEGYELEWQIHFGACIADTDVTDSADHRQHLARAVDGECPTTGSSYGTTGTVEGVAVPEITVSIFWNVEDADVNTSAWTVSCDGIVGGLPDGRCMHADWFGAWDEPTVDLWMLECINSLRDCAGGQLGGDHDTPNDTVGTRLDDPGDNFTSPYGTTRLVDPPE